MPDYSLIVADGRRSTYGMAAILGAIEHLDAAAYPRIEWPTRERPLRETVAATVGAGRRAIVLWSFFSTSFTAATARLAAVRAATPPGADVVHLAGGAHASAEPELTARAGWDLVAPGEGEHTMRALVAALHSGMPLHTVPGLAHLDDAGFHPARGRPLEDLDDAPSFSVRAGRVGPIEITRGCIYACKFCQTPFLFKARFRHRSIASVRDHVRRQLTLDMTDVRFLTPTSMSYGARGEDPDLDAIERLLRAVREELPSHGRVYFGSFPSEIRPEHASMEALSLVKRLCDNDNVIIGGQSGSDRMLLAAGRGHGTDIVRTAVENCNRVGLRANVDVLFGMPGESAADAEATIALCRDLAALGARIHTHTFMPLPGTPWSHREPGTIDERLRQAIRELEARGQAYGSWEAQQALAQELAAFDSFANRRKAARTRQGSR